jgi:hypothetical protein
MIPVSSITILNFFRKGKAAQGFARNGAMP